MYPNVDWTDEMEAAADAAWAPLMEDGDLLERRARRSSSHRTNSHRSGTRKKGTRRTSTKPRAKRIKLPKVKTASLSTDIQGAKGRIVTNISGRADLLEVMAIRLAELRRDFSQILYNEEQHPRDNHGRYIGGNGAVGVNLHRRIQNGLAYIQDQIVRNIPWHQAMWNGRHGLDTIMNHVQELEANRTAIAQGLEARDIVELQALYHQYQVTSQLADSTHPPAAFDAQEAQRRQEIMQTIAGFLAEREKKTGNTVSLDAAATARAFASLPHQLRTSLEQQVGYLDPAMKALAGQRLHAHLSNAELAYPAERPANQDLQGQTMPFIAATVVDAFLHGELAGDQGNMNETRFATINGQRYAIKTLLPNPVRPGKVDGARNEAATVAIAKAAGLESVVPTQTYHVQGTDGKQYSVATFMLGEANQQNMPAIAPLVSPESVQQSLVLQHLMLLDDRRPPNALVDIQGHTLTEIDNEFAFWHAADPRNSYSYQILRAQNPSAVMPLIDRSVVQSVVDRQAQIEQTLQRLPLTPDERYLVGTRLDTMKWALLTGKPLTMYLLMTPQYQQRANVPDAITSLRFRLADLQRTNPNRDSHGRFTAGAGHADLTTYHAKVTSLGTKYHEAHATHPTVAKAHAALLKAIEKAGTPPPVDFDGLIPINKNIPTRVDVYGPPDRVFLLGTYGPAQLAKALGRYGTGILRESVKEVQRQQQEQRHPPTAPTSNDRKAIIAYLVKHTNAAATKTAKAAPQRATFLESMTIRLAELQRYAGQQIVRGPNGKIIGNISAGGGIGKGDRLASYHHDMAALQSKYATLLTEVPTIKTAHNAAVKAAEEALVAPAKSAGKTKKAASTQVKLAAAQQVELPKPIKYIPMSAFNPYQPIDVKLLLEGYGLDNLPQVLNTMTPNVLNKSAVAMATAQGLPLPANQKKETLIAYLMYHTAGVGEPPPTKATKTAGKTAGQPRQPKKPVTIQDDGLVPIKIGINYNFNPLAPPDPSFLLSMYGEAQLEKALNRYSPARLKETIKLHLANAPKLKSKSTKAEIIAYIKQHTVSTPTEPQRSTRPTLSRYEAPMHTIYYQLANQLATLTLRLATITRDNSMSAASVIRVNGRYAGSLPRSSGIEAEAKLHDIKPGSVGEKGLRTAANKGASSLTPEQHQALLQHRAELEKFVTASGRNVTPAQRRSAMHGISIIDKHLERYNAAKAKAAPAPRTAMKKVDLKPLPGADLSGFGKLNSLSGVNPVFELKSYGAAQLPTALAQYGKEDLKSATKTLLTKYPGLTPPNRASKSAMVNFLAKHTINPAEAAKQSEAGMQAKAAASTKPRKGK